MSWSEPEFAAIAALVTDEFGLEFPPARRVFAEAAIRRALGLARERTLARYLHRLVAEPDLLPMLSAEVTVGETYFFRDEVQFEALRTTVLPDIARRHNDGTLRVWSAGCSTGEEAYSLAILLGELGLAGRAYVLATDVSSTSIDTARRGEYGAWSFRHDNGGRRERCFVRTGKRWAIAPEYRGVEFTVHNLMQPAPASILGGGFDLIVCRNVMLYFERETVARAARLLADALVPGGWLIMSPTDPLLPNELGLESVLTPAGIAFRRPLPASDMASAPLRAPIALPKPPLSAPAPRVGRAPRTAHPVTRPSTPRERPDAEAYVARALTFLDASQPHEAAVSARRALFLDRSLAIAHLALARALRLTGNLNAAQRALLRGAALLEAQAPDEAVRGAGGASAGTLSAVAAAELDLLVGAPT